MQRFKQPNMDLHPDGEWIRYEDHCEAMKRIAGETKVTPEQILNGDVLVSQEKHTVEQVRLWASAYRDEGGHGLIVQMLESYAELLTKGPAPAALTDEAAMRVALRIMANLEDRNGLLDGVDDDTKADIADEIAVTIRAASPADQVEIERLRRISWLIGSIFVHGNFVAETFNERELESLLRKQGTFWETLSEFDAAMSASKEGA